MEFYTNCVEYKSKLLLTGYKDGTRFNTQIGYKPYLYLPTKGEGTHKTIDGSPVVRKDFPSIWEAKQFLRNYKDVNGFDIYGLDKFNYVYLRDTYPNIKPDTSLIKTAVLDIEVATDDGFPNIETANKQVTAITLMYDNITFTFGYVDFKTDHPEIKYIKCKDEVELLEKFLKLWSSDVFRPDVVTGWNIEMFDIPYIVRRIAVVLGDQEASKLSPFGVLQDRKFESFGRQQTVFTPVGVNILDYYSLYKKFSNKQQESYKLDHICEVELGEKKLDYSQYGSLNALYVANPQLYIEYNIHDCWLIKKLDKKMQLLKLVYAFAYDSGTNMIDALTSVRAWDIIIHNFLADRKIVVPQLKYSIDSDKIQGAHVKDPLVGMYKWVVSMDLTSLYPHLIIGYNISPDTLRGTFSDAPDIDDIIKNGLDPNIRKRLTDFNQALAANGCVYTRDKVGFLPELMQNLFDKRKQFKDQMLKAKQQYQSNPTPELSDMIAEYDIMQQAIKIKLNSCYGALANAGLRWSDKRLGASITYSGQLTIKWAEDRINKLLNKLLKTTDKDYVIASDTDSIYLNMGPLVDKHFSDLTDDDQICSKLDQFCEQVIQPKLNKIYAELAETMNAYKQAMHMKREMICNKGIFVQKKRYIVNMLDNEGVRFAEPKIKMVGIEAVKSSTPAASREAIKQTLQVILNQDESATIDYIANLRAEFRKMPFEQIASPRGMNGLWDYYDKRTIYKPGTPIHVRGALLYNNLINKMNLVHKYDMIVDKEKIRFCYLKMPNPLHENVIAASGALPSEFGLDQYIDHDLQFEKAYLEPIKSILNAIGWDHEKRNRLSSFFAA